MRKESEPAVKNYSEESYVGNYGNLYITDAYFGVGITLAEDSIKYAESFANSSSCASASSSNARKLDEQILEVKINPQEKNTVSDTSTNKDTLSKEKESENENEETKLIRNYFEHYVGMTIDADLREQILKLGPYQPEGNFQKEAKKRSFSSSYYSFISKAGQKIERKWLCYSTRLHVAVSLTSIENLRNDFANIKEVAIGLAKKWGITPEFEKKRLRKVTVFR
ncbi:hypothetical protein TNCV_12341 [Trichonephila clavipes]|nr:hypothetical protein TNCV_12341 [Trichonephila clavipes]